MGDGDGGAVAGEINEVAIIIVLFGDNNNDGGCGPAILMTIMTILVMWKL